MKRNISNHLGARAIKSCQDCSATHTGGFRKVASLYGTRVAIFLHTRSILSGSDQCDKSSQTREYSRNPETFIVHNTSDIEITKNTMVRELNKYKTSCVTCMGIIKRVRTLLEEIRAIRRNEVHAICDHCITTSVKCKRCVYVLDKYKQSNAETRDLLFKQWLCKVKQLLETISKGNICNYKLYQETSDAAELDKLMMELSSPMLAQRHLEIGGFPPMEFQENLAQSKDMLQELITKLKYESGTRKCPSDDSLFMRASAGCICKYIMDRKTEQRKALQTLNQQEIEPPELAQVSSKVKLISQSDRKETTLKENRVNEKEKPKKGSSTTSKEKSIKAKKGSSTTEKEKSTKVRKGSSTTEKSMTDKSNKARKGSSTEISSVTDKENKEEKKTKKAAQSEESKLFKKLLAQRSKNKERVEKQPKDVKTKLPSFGELPKVAHIKRREVVEDFSESILECDDGVMRSPNEMITGKKVVPLHARDIIKADPVKPLQFKVRVDSLPSVVKAETGELPPKSATHLSTPSRKKSEIPDRSGVIRYRLSDREFIDKGWTQLPSTKILRRMNVYKMVPARRDDWFHRHRRKGVMFYDSGEKLAAVQEDGQGKWFYKNGMVALEYYHAEEMFVRKRCVVYSRDVCVQMKAAGSQAVLACFDTLGNGVIYDHRGNERLKYNQTEGHLIDARIGPPGYWKWHTLNDPPVLQKTFIDTYAEDRSTFKKTRDDEDHEESQRNLANEEMLAIEFENFVREKANKLQQEFRPFHIRMKTVKINDYFTVRVIDQANVSLFFRDGALTMKLDLGMLLQNKEIIDTDCVELSLVGTPYDRKPARSKSVDRLQTILSAARRKLKECDHCYSPANSV